MHVKIIETEERIEIWWGGFLFASRLKSVYQAMGLTPEWMIANEFRHNENLLCDYLQTQRDAGAFIEKPVERVITSER